MTVRFDRRSGRLRLDQPACDALLAWAGGAEAAGPGIAELREAGVIVRGRPHAAVAPAVHALSEPVCRLQVELRPGDGAERGGSGWVMSQAAALLLDLPEGLRELVTVHPTFVPAGLARVVGLGPRPRVPAEPLHLPEPLAAALTGPDVTARRDAADSISNHLDGTTARRVVRSLGRGSAGYWSVRASWPAAPDRAGERLLRVVDTGDAGLWLVEPGDGLTALWPTTPTVVWRALTALLPGDDELVPGLIAR